MTFSKICHVGIQINRFKEKSLLFFKTIFTKLLERCLWSHQYKTRHNKLEIDQPENFRLHFSVRSLVFLDHFYVTKSSIMDLLPA